jgi:hypothetical protein
VIQRPVLQHLDGGMALACRLADFDPGESGQAELDDKSLLVGQCRQSRSQPAQVISEHGAVLEQRSAVEKVESVDWMRATVGSVVTDSQVVRDREEPGAHRALPGLEPGQGLECANEDLAGEVFRVFPVPGSEQEIGDDAVCVAGIEQAERLGVVPSTESEHSVGIGSDTGCAHLVRGDLHAPPPQVEAPSHQSGERQRRE